MVRGFGGGGIVKLKLNFLNCLKNNPINFFLSNSVEVSCQNRYRLEFFLYMYHIYCKKLHFLVYENIIKNNNDQILKCTVSVI